MPFIRALHINSTELQGTILTTLNCREARGFTLCCVTGKKAPLAHSLDTEGQLDPAIQRPHFDQSLMTKKAMLM